MVLALCLLVMQPEMTLAASAASHCWLVTTLLSSPLLGGLAGALSHRWQIFAD